MNTPPPSAPGRGSDAPQPEPPHVPAPVDIAEESIAGEEDPGASLDLEVGGPAPAPSPSGTQQTKHGPKHA